MQHLTSMYDSEGQIYDLPSDKVDAFREKRGGERALDYRLPDGREYSIPESQATRFAEVHPDAQPMRSLTFANGSTRRFTSSELRDFMTREYRESDDYKADRDASAARAKEMAPDMDKPTEVAGDSAAEDMLWAARRGRDYVAGKFVGGLSHVFTGAMRLADSAAKAFGTEPFFDNKEIADSIDKALAPTKEEAEAVGAPVRAAGAVAGTAGSLLTWDRAFSGLGFWGGNALMTAEAGNDAYLSTFDAGIASGKTPEEADAIAKKSGVAATATTALYGLAIRSLGNLFSGKTTVGADSFKDVKVPNYDSLVKAVQRGELMKYIKNGLAASAGAGAAGGAGDYFQTVYGKEAMGDEANWTDPEAWWNAAKGFATAFGLTGALAGFGYKQFKNAVYDAVEAQARAAATTPETRAAWREMFPEGTRNVIAKRALGKDISRSDIKNAGFPEMSLKERNAVGDAMLRDYMEAKKGKTPPKQLTDGTQPPAADTGTQPIKPTEPPKLPTETTTKEIPNETGNVPDEKPAQPKPPVETRAEGSEAVRPVEGEPPRGEAPRPDVVKPAEKPKEPPAPPKTGEDTPKPAEGVEAASRASDAKPVPDGKGKMVKPKVAESDYGVTMFEEPAVDGEGVSYVVKDGPSDAHRMMFRSKAEAEARLAELRAERKAIKESPSATLADGTKVHLLKTDEGWVPYNENYVDLRRGLFKAAKTKAGAIKVAEKGVKWAKDVAEFDSAFKRFEEDFGLDEFNKKVGWGNENGEGWNEPAALEHLRQFDLEKLKDMKERAKRFNLGHHNGRNEKIQEWFDKVISEKSPIPDGKGKMVKPKSEEPPAPVAHDEKSLRSAADQVQYLNGLANNKKEGFNPDEIRKVASEQARKSKLSETLRGFGVNAPSEEALHDIFKKIGLEPANHDNLSADLRAILSYAADAAKLRKQIGEVMAEIKAERSKGHSTKGIENNRLAPLEKELRRMEDTIQGTVVSANKIISRMSAPTTPMPEPAKPKPDGKGKLAKPKKEKTARREPQDVSALNEAIKEAKTVAKSGENKLFEVKVGTTTVKFLSNEKGIEHAEKMAKTLSTVKDWSPKYPESKTPSAPKPLKVAKGKNLAGFDDISKEYVSKGKNARTGLTKPIVKDGMVYATDGRSIIRMPAEGVADTKDAPDVAKVYPENRKGKVLENFTFNPSESHVGLEQASALTSKDGTVEMWRSPTGEIMFRSREADYAWSPSSTASFVGSSLKGADFIGSFNPDYLSKAFQTLAKLGVKDAEVEWRGATSALYVKGGDAEILIMPKHSGKVDADTTVQLLGGKRRLTDAGRTAALEEEIKVEQERAKARDPKITQASLDQIAKRYRNNEAKTLAKIKETDGKQDPMFSRAPEGDLPDLSTEPPKSPEAEISERLDLKRLDPKRRSDPKVLAWAKKNGRNVTNGMVTPDAVRAYDEAMTENTGRLVKRWFPDMKIVAHKFGEKIKRGVHVLDLRDTSGGVLGWFDPKSKEVHLLPGADPKTVAHEIMWHGTRDYISQLAVKGDARAQRFLDMMHDVEKNIPEPLKKKIIAIYTKGTKAPTSDTLMNEFGAWFTMGKGGKALEDAMTTAEGRNWFAKALYAVKEVYKDFLAKHGGNRVDLSEVDGMTRDEFVDFLAKEFAGGKTLGEITGKTNALSTKETKLQAYRRKAYDNNAPVRDLERDIEKKTGKKISADDSVEAANALKYGLKEAANIEIQGKMADFRKTLGESGIHYEDLEYYAALKAAAGRDAKIDKRNIDKLTEDMKKAGASAQDIADAIADYKSTNGSHIDPREAKKMLAEIENGPDAAKYKAAYDKLRAIIDETLDTQVAAGLVDAKDAAQWRAEEPNYVPFKNEYDPESGDWEGRGTSRNFVQPEHRMAKGRQSAAGDIIAHVFMDHQAAKHRAIENDVRKKLAELVRANPEIGKVELLRKESVKNIEKDDPNVVVFKDGGRSYAIRLNGTRGAAIANAFTQRNLVKMEWADKGFEVFGKKISFRNFAHWSSGMATRYSPTFAIRNTTKDNIELANIVYSERGPIEGTKFMASYAANRAKMALTLAKYVATGKIDTSTTEGQILDRYIKAGGLIAGGVRAEGMDSIKARLSPKAIAKEMKRGKSRLVAAGKHVVNSIAYLNEYAEMATRVGVFATEVKAGKSDAEAALFSRRATVDFNRHGDYTPAFNVFRLFSNSTLGATARAAAALGKSKYGKYAALAMFANGLAQALIEYFYNQDEDERREKTGEATGKDMSEFDRKTSLFYFRDGDKVYKVAQHESPFSLLTYAGNSVGRWLCGEIDGADVARNLGVSTAELAYNFLPMGQINLQSRKGGFVNDLHAALVSGICPSVLQPIAELAWNVDFKGDTVLRETMNAYDPKSHNGKEHTPDWAKQSAEWLNDSTGGNAGRRGFVDIAPEAIQNLVEGYGKNALRDVSAAYSVGKAIADGDISGLDPRNTPVKRDFMRPLDGNDRRFNDALSQYKADKNEVSKMKDAWTDEELSAYEDAHPWVADAEVKNAVSEIQKLRKMEQGFSYKTGKATPYEWSKEEIEEFKKERRELQAFVLEKMHK